MPKKAVYNNKMLAIYISGDDFKELLERTTLDVKIYIGKVMTERDYVVVKTLGGSRYEIERAYKLEHEAIEAARSPAKQFLTKYLTSEETHGDKKHGKG